MNEPLTPEAASFWQLVPEWAKVSVLTNVWCGGCQDRTTMLQVSGEMVKGDLLLRGIYNRCGAKVARLVEGA